MTPFPQQLAQPHAGLVELRLRIADRAIQDPVNFVVFISLYVVKYKDAFIPYWKLLDRPFKANSIN
jgi:hypothetical protein